MFTNIALHVYKHFYHVSKHFYHVYKHFYHVYKHPITPAALTSKGFAGSWIF